jgi:hypothetical protein
MIGLAVLLADAAMIVSLCILVVLLELQARSHRRAIRQRIAEIGGVSCPTHKRGVNR